MKKLIYLLSFALAAGLTAAGQAAGQGAQTQPQTQTPPVTSTTPATNIGSGAQTKAGTPATTSGAGTTTGQGNPTGTGAPPESSTNPQGTGGVSGAVSSSATQPGSSEGATGVAAVTDSDLEGQIQNALNKEPTLSGDSTHVKVSGDTVEVNGNVNSNKEKVTATRIVQSYAGSKKLVNHLTVSGRSGNTSSPHSEPQDQTDRTATPGNSDRGNPNPATNPEPNKGSKPPKG